MSAMPAVRWPEAEKKEAPLIAAKRELDQLIYKVESYRELVQEYPTTMVYWSLLEEAERDLKAAEKRLSVSPLQG